jgi:soluble lytic murein transglycosylase-like protein
MRHSLLVTCLLLTAWADPAGNLTDPNSMTAAAGASVVEKTTDGSAAERDAYAGPAETTKQLIEFDDVAIAPVPKDESPVTAESPLRPSVDALAALDAVADGFDLTPARPIPLPPHRAIPHTEVCEALASAAEINDVPTPFFIRLIWQESGFRQNIISPAGAIGVAQFMPTTAAENGLDDPFNPLQAVRASARLLRDLIKQFGNVGLAAAAYNAGPRRVQDWLDKRGKLPQETQDYVEHITGKKAEQWKIKTASATPLRVPERAPCQREAGLYAANGPELIPLPPVQAKDEPAKPEPVKTAKALAAKAKTKVAEAATKTVSAKSAAKPDKKHAVHQALAIHPAPAKDQSKLASNAKAQKASAKNASKTGGKAKKVKVADAEARK